MDTNLHPSSPQNNAPVLPLLHKPQLLQLIFFICLTGLIFIAYSGSLDGPFIFDDSRIENNPQVHLTDLSATNLFKAGFQSSPQTRPLSHMTFALNYYFHGLNTRGYHLVNITIHIITAFLLYLFIQATLNLPSLHSRYGSYTWLPFVAALIWALHPLQTQSVAYIIQRMNSMAAMFYILALYLYIRGRLARHSWEKLLLFFCCALAGILALGSKETAATLPFFIFIYEWFFFQDLNPKWLKGKIVPAVIILAFLVFLSLLYLRFNPLDSIMASYGKRDFTLIQRILTQFRVVVFYISLIIFPHPDRLNLDHQIAFSTGLFSPVSTFISALILSVLFGSSLAFAKKYRLISFCLLWFLGNLVIESSVIGLELIYEHRNYLPSMMLVLLLALLLWPIIQEQRLKIAFFSMILLLITFWTYERSRVWNDRISLWSDSVAKSPAKARPHNNLAVALKRNGQLHDAVHHFKKTVNLDPSFFEAYYNLANTYMMLGRIKAAISEYKMALTVVPNNATVHAALGSALYRNWQLEEALYHLTEAVRLNPQDINARINLASVQQMIKAKNMRKKKLP